MVTGRQADPAGLESHRSTPAASDPHQTKRAASERSFRLGDSWSLRGLEGGFSRDGNGELGKENDGGREKQVEKKGEKGRVKSMSFKGDRNVQEDKEGDDEWDKEEGDEKEESRSLNEGEEETDGESKQFHVSDDLELVLSHGQARVRRRLAERRQTRARLADCVPCTSDNDGEDSKLQGFQSGQGGEMDENAGGGDSGSELEGSRKLLQESAPCCDPLVLKLRVQTADLERRMGQIAEKQVSFDEQVRFDEQAESKRVSREKYVLNKKLSRADANWEALFLSNQSMHEAQMTVQRCNGHGIVAQQGTLVWKGYTCDASDEALTQYTTYDASGACPDDWFPTQSLTFHHHCFLVPPPLLIFPASQSLVLPPLPPPRATHGYTCDASDEALRQYTSYDASGAWPDDWFPTQSLIFHHRCFLVPPFLPHLPRYPFPSLFFSFLLKPQGYTCDAADEALTQYTTYDASGACPDDWFPTQALIFHHHCQLIPPPLPLFCSPPPQGYTCDASDEALRQYTTYDASGACPDDWFATQSLIFQHRCFSLPQRRCRARTTNQTINPLPFPQALFNLSALIDTALVWDHHACSSFACLNARVVGDCRLCFNLTLERNRWRVRYRGSLTIEDVLKMKQGSIRLGLDIGGGTGSFAAHMALYNVTILTTCLPFLPLFTPPPFCRLGLDIGGGTGSFAAHMALYNVTILTTAMNVETVVGRKQGLPYMEAIALRGLIPLHLPHKARLPFFDGSSGIIHSVNNVGVTFENSQKSSHQARLPFFDGSSGIIHSVNSVKWPSFLPPSSLLSAHLPFFDGALDIIHSVNSVKYLPMLEFEEMLFEWDRVLRVGGVIWLEMFYAPLDEFPVYVAILDLLGYNRLHWRVLPSPSLPCPPPPSGGVIWLEMFYAPLDEFPVYVAILNLLGYNHLHWRVLPSPSLPCPPPPSGGVIWLEMFYAPLDEFPVYVAILNLLSYNRLHWRVLPKPDPGERKGPHVYLNCLLEKPVRREEGWVEAGRREEGRGEEEGGREVGGREGGTSEETGGKEEGMEREVGGREEGGRREEGRGEGSSNHRSEGDVEKGRRIEGEGIGEGSRQWGAEEDRKRDERNGKMERKEEERKEEAVKEDSNRTEERGREEERREERRERRREYGSEEWNEEVVEEAGTSIEKFAREWYREEEGSRETEGSRESGGSREQGAAREDEIQTAKEKAERPSWCEEDYADGGRGRRGAGGSEDDSGWGKELFRVHRTPKDGASKVIVVFEKSQKRKSARDGGRGRRGGGGSEDDSGFGKKPFRVHRISKDGASKVIVVFEKSQKRKSARDGGRGRRGGGGSEDDSGFGKKPFRVHRTSKDGASKVIVVFEKSQKRKSARDRGRGRSGGGGSEDDSGWGKELFGVR
ncbi:unnamed protein product [Closterium sp. Naga37s-1]|nr:unnamed protein product [Closterium sp. Naga37s-1]